jgi:hypothetical protein
MAHRSTWHRLMESTEGPTVTVQIPREWAEELLRAIATSLEIDDVGDDLGDGDLDGLDVPHMEPDEDDLGGTDDFEFGGEGDGLDDDEPAGDDDEDDSDDDDEEDDEKDEATDYSKSGGNPSGLRSQTALGESKLLRIVGPRLRK